MCVSRCRVFRKKPTNCGGIFDVDNKVKRLDELENAMQNPDVWNNHQQMQKINQEKVMLEREIAEWKTVKTKLDDAEVLLEMVEEEGDESTFKEIQKEVSGYARTLEAMELKSLLTGEMDFSNCYLTINAGAGGTEACDWAQIILRMFTRWAERKGYNAEIVSMTEGEEAGIKSATLSVEGPYAYGYLRAENGVHRLVRVSPFDSNARRHTSFASVFAWPEVNEDIQIEVKDEDIKVDTYRAGGAGGQHVNKTDSAVRITHIPTGIVVQCQNQRSQHANRDKAMKMLKAALYEKEMERRKAQAEELSADKMANEWGSQIRSYVLHPYQLVKDHRTGYETSQSSDVLDGDLDDFINAQLKAQAHSKGSGASRA